MPVFMLLFFSSLTLPVAHAFKFEAGGGYEKGDLKSDTETKTLSGPGLNLKFGSSSTAPFSLGGELSWSSLKSDSETEETPKDYTSLQLGPYLSLDLPDIPFIPKRVWASYLPYDRLTREAGDSSEEKVYKGSSFRVGVGDSIPILPITVSAVYTSHNYGEIDNGNGSSTSETASFETYGVYLSADFDL